MARRLPPRECETLVMVRTECCEQFRQSGVLCTICPERAENAAAVLAFRRWLEQRVSLGRRLPSSASEPEYKTAC